MNFQLLEFIIISAFSVNAHAIAPATAKSLNCFVQINPVRGLVIGGIGPPEQRTLAENSDRTGGTKLYARVTFEAVPLGDVSLGNDTVNADALVFGDGDVEASMTFASVTASTGVIAPKSNGAFEIKSKERKSRFTDAVPS